jgi:uncharacterized protein (DUF2147 family)
MLHNQLMFKFLILFSFILPVQNKTVAPESDLVCGKWIAQKKNLIVQVYRDGDTYKGKLIWYDNTDKSKAMDEWTDTHNPDPALRSRKILGMNILTDLVYSPRSKTWENGKIYDAKTGHEWSAVVQINKDGLLKVTAYWGLKFIGRTVLFTKG